MERDATPFYDYGNNLGLSTAQIHKLFVIAKEIFFGSDKLFKLRNNYFGYRDMLHAEGNTGYSKVELHELAKKYIFPKLIENPDNFIDGGKNQKELSVTWLSEQGWKSYIEEFKLFCAENFNFYL